MSRVAPEYRPVLEGFPNGKLMIKNSVLNVDKT
jgi:hypothetical protein